MGGVVDELFDGFGVVFGSGDFALDVAAGDPKAVEEEPGAAGVDFIGGDFVQKKSDGELDTAAIGQVRG